MSTSARSSRRLFVLAVTMSVLATVAVPAAAVGVFEDDDGNVHEADIEFIASIGITFGCNPPDNDQYCPDDLVTRAQMASFLARTFGVSASSENHFTDDDGNVHEGNINAIADAGITVGCNPPANTSYCPNDFVTRAQMATFIIRGLGDVEPFNAPIFNDVLRGETHTGNINALAGVDVTRGCNQPDNDLYCPFDFVTRAQMASFLARLVRLGDSRPPDVEITSPAHLSTIMTESDASTNQFVADVTFTASAMDPNGDAIASYRWDSTVGGFLGTGNPLEATLVIPQGETSSQPFISVVATDDTGLFSGAEIQVKLIMPSP